MYKTEDKKPKGQNLILKANCQAVNSYEQINLFFTAMRRVFLCFLEEIEVNKKTFRN